MKKNNKFKILNLPRSVVVGAVEENIQKLFSNSSMLYSDKILINLEECMFIEIASLAILFAFIRKRNLLGFTTKINLPKTKDVRDFLRTWDFEKAFDFTTGARFRDSVEKENLKYFGENKRISDNKYYNEVNLDGVTRLLSNRFFSFKILLNDISISKAECIHYEVKRWEQELILSTLEKYLSSKGQFIASRIIYEGLTNAATHPNANFVLISSHFDMDRSLKIKDKGFFTLIIWDDGLSMIETIKDALQQRLNIKNEEINEKEYKIYEKYQSPESLTSNIIKSTIMPSIESTEDEILLSTTLPGITSDIKGEKHLSTNFASISNNFKPGIGLYILVKTVLEDYQGSISFRTKNYFMNIKPPLKTIQRKYSARFQIKILKYPDLMPEFLGNLITIRLPIRG